MIKTENECVDCGLPCLGKSCPYTHVTRIYCDRCGKEITNDILAWVRETDKYAPEEELRKWIKSDVLRLPEEPKKQPAAKQEPTTKNPKKPTAWENALAGNKPWEGNEVWRVPQYIPFK